jgi:hypothetical protein
MTEPKPGTRRTKRPKSYTLDVTNQADLTIHLSYCIEIVCKLIEQLQSEGKCDPALLESLRGIQVEIDRQTRRIKRDGYEPKNTAIAGQLSHLQE